MIAGADLSALRHDGAAAGVLAPRDAVEHPHDRLPNRLRVEIRHIKDGSVEVFEAFNLRVNNGIDWQAGAMGDTSGATGTSTAVGTTSMTDSGASWTTNQWAGKWVTSGGRAGRIASNTGTVLTIDQWITGDGNVGSNPATGVYNILPGRSNASFMAITTDATAAGATDSSLTSEETTNGLARVAATYSHTTAATSYSLAKTFTYTGSSSKVIAKIAEFVCLTGGTMAFETLLAATGTVNANGDQITITHTVNI